jgi:hypothetical protein
MPNILKPSLNGSIYTLRLKSTRTTILMLALIASTIILPRGWSAKCSHRRLLFVRTGGFCLKLSLCPIQEVGCHPTKRLYNSAAQSTCHLMR